MQEGRSTTAGHSAKCRAVIQVILADDVAFQEQMAKAEERKNRYCEDVIKREEAQPE